MLSSQSWANQRSGEDDEAASFSSWTTWISNRSDRSMSSRASSTSTSSRISTLSTMSAASAWSTSSARSDESTISTLVASTVSSITRQKLANRNNEHVSKADSDVGSIVSSTKISITKFGKGFPDSEPVPSHSKFYNGKKDDSLYARHAKKIRKKPIICEFDNKKIPSAFKVQFDRSVRNLYSKTGVSSEELDGLKEAMELLVSDKIRVYDEIISEVFVAEIWTTSAELWEKDPRMCDAWPFKNRQECAPPTVHVKFFIETNHVLFNKWLVLPFGGSKFIPPPANLKIGARYVVHLQRVYLGKEAQPWHRIKGHWTGVAKSEGTEWDALIPLNPIPWDNFNVVALESNRPGEQFQFIQLLATIYRRPNLGHAVPNEHVEFAFGDLGMAVSLKSDELFKEDDVVLEDWCSKYRAVLEPLPNNVINMVEWRILHSSVKPQEKYRSRVVWRITSVMWTPGSQEETRGPYKVKVVHAPILELPVLGCWDLFDTSTRPNAGRVIVTSAIRDYHFKKSLGLEDELLDCKICLLHNVLHYLMLRIPDFRYKRIKIPSPNIFDRLWKLNAKIGAKQTYEEFQGYVFPACVLLNQFINSIEKVNELFKMKDEGFLLAFTIVFALHVCKPLLVNTSSGIDWDHVKVVYKYLTDGVHWTISSHLMFDYIEPLPLPPEKYEPENKPGNTEQSKEIKQ
ncbi:hypothetical protein WR25_09669 [Diploscapter pachys]|uniref:Uncharacterized protein n=1 Tax=Diploscapter pachys TaxID=2018661 RepID=A0A2A2K7Y0_9BILA|nr:hypothetical protein WR25_09669 [Diploscapter pachys]